MPGIKRQSSDLQNQWTQQISCDSFAHLRVDGSLPNSSIAMEDLSPLFPSRKLGDHVVEGLHDCLVEGGEDFLQVTARHDQLAKSSVMCFAR